MQILVESADISKTLRSFGTGITIDAKGWSEWYVATVKLKPVLHGMQQGKVATEIRALLEGLDGVILWLENGTCLAIFQKLGGFAVDEFSATLRRNLSVLPSKSEVNAYSVNDNLQDVTLILMHALKTCGENIPTTQVAAPDMRNSVHRLDDLMSLWERTYNQAKQRIQPHIMIVDDDATTRAIVSHSLKREYPVLTAQTAADAIRKHILFTPNIVFLDINLPDHKGFDYLRHIRQYDTSCRIIMFSSNSYLSNRLTAYASGATGFIAKPFNRRAFEHYLSGWREAPLAKATERVLA